MKQLLIFCCCLVLAPALLLGCAEDQTSNALFPDPYVPGDTNITFTDLNASCTIEIYTLEQQLVRTITETDGDGQAVWDIKNEDGEDVSSGIYLYVITENDGIKKGKLVITK
ncbi:T9SS type A sorting domain-containing protein [Candidatus Margulisiibacteriota bacterium]